jgi:hypothetical protein
MDTTTRQPDDPIYQHFGQIQGILIENSQQVSLFKNPIFIKQKFSNFKLLFSDIDTKITCCYFPI